MSCMSLVVTLSFAPSKKREEKTNQSWPLLVGLVVQQRIFLFQDFCYFDVSASWRLQCPLQTSVTVSQEKSSEKWHLFFSDVSSSCSVKALRYWDNSHRILSQRESRLVVAFKQICLNFFFTASKSKYAKKYVNFKA